MIRWTQGGQGSSLATGDADATEDTEDGGVTIRERRDDLLAGAGLFGIVLVLFADVLFVSDRVPSMSGHDLTSQYLPWWAFGFGELARGELPLWNPYAFSGSPFFGNFQTALLYPPNWLHLVLPTAVAVSWGFALHVFLCGIGTYAWCRIRASSVAASFLAGGAVMLSGPVFLHVLPGHLPYLCSLAWTPLIFFAVDGIVKTGR